MALFFSGFVFFRNLLAPSESGLSFRKIRIEKIDLIRLSLWEGKRQDLNPCSAVHDSCDLRVTPIGALVPAYRSGRMAVNPARG